MLGFYSAKTVSLLFGENRVASFHKTFSLVCAIAVLLSTLLAIGILKFDLHNGHPIHHLLRYTVATALVLLAFFAIICTLSYVRRDKAPIYSVLPLLLTPIAFTIYGLELIDYDPGLTSTYSVIYAISRLLNCICFTYALIVIRRNTRHVVLFLSIQLTLALTLLFLHSKSLIYDTSLIIWVSMAQFNVSLLVGTSVVRTGIEKINLSSVATGEAKNNSREFVRIRAWLPNDEDNGQEHLNLPLIGRYVFSYSLKRRDFLVGHITVESDQFYASIYPDPSAWQAEKQNKSSRRSIGKPHRMFFPGNWQSLSYDIEKRGHLFNICNVNVVDPEYLTSVWQDLQSNTSYSLYRRNCAIVTIKLFEACIRHSLIDIPFTSGIIRTYLSTHFWSAIIAKQRSEIFTWTPGLAYDYVLNLSLLISELRR